MTDTPKVDRRAFEDVVKNLLRQPTVKREDIKTDARKPAKIIQPQQNQG